MCDYSLMAIPKRLAVEQEDLIAHRFPTGSMGLASPADLRKSAGAPAGPPRGFWASLRTFFNPPRTEPVPAVCIPPGARLMLHDIPARLQNELRVEEEEEVMFTQISSTVNNYRDSVRFANGRMLRLQELREGQRVTVLDLSCAEAPNFDFLNEEHAATLRRIR